MQIYSKQGQLFYVQTDSLSGELLGSAIDELYAAGACNVQVIPSVTKKNRPGHVFLIDTRKDCAESVEQTILRELRVTGWHRIDSEHRHLQVDYLKRTVTFQGMGSCFTLELEAKKAYGQEVFIRPEHRSCVKLKQALQACGYIRSLPECYEILGEIFAGACTEYQIKGES